MDDATRHVGGEGKRAEGKSRNAQTSDVEAQSSDIDQRALEIRKDIARTRDGMSETINAIQDRLTPANLVAQAGETVRQAATEKVKQMANSAGLAADQLRDSSVMETVRSNPIPAAMIGIGAAWLVMKGRSGSRAYGYPSDSSGRQFASDVRSTVAQTGRPAQLSFDRVMRDNPLALGIAAVIVGAAVGLSIPATETENELMGEARDTVVERARTLASDAASKVSDAAGQVEDIASRAANAVGSDAARAEDG